MQRPGLSQGAGLEGRVVQLATRSQLRTWSRGDGGLDHALVARRPSTPTTTKAGRERGKTKLFPCRSSGRQCLAGIPRTKHGGCKTRGCLACIVPRLLGRSIPFGRGTKAKRGIDFQAGRAFEGRGGPDRLRHPPPVRPANQRQSSRSVGRFALEQPAGISAKVALDARMVEPERLRQRWHNSCVLGSPAFFVGLY
jgi:hypothetical protein